MLRLLLGRAGSGKTGRIVNEIKDNISQGQNGLVLVVPEQYSHEAERMLCEKCGVSTSLYAEVLSFTRMCSRVFSEVGGAADKFIDEAGKILAMSRAIETAAPYLHVYGAVTHRSEFISKLVETAKEFRSARITLGDVTAASKSVGALLKKKLDDIALILDVYWSYLEKDIKDPDERLDRLAELIPKSSISRHGKIWIDGFSDFTAQQLNVIEALLGCQSDVTISLTCDTTAGNSVIFDSAARTVEILTKLCGKNGCEMRTEYMSESMLGRPDELKHLEKYLFAGEAPAFDGKRSAVSLFTCDDAAEECELAAAKAIELVKNGARWNEIAVAAGDYEGYSGVVDSIFKKYDVPVYQNIKTDILKMPPVLAVSAAMRIIAAGWDYDNMFTYFKSGFSGLTPDECDRLENYVLTWNIRGSMWYRDELWDMSQDGYKAPADENALEEINCIRSKGTAPLIQLRKGMHSAENNAGKLSALLEFMENISLFENLEIYTQKFEAAGDRRMASCCERLGGILSEAMEQFYSVAGDCASGLDDFIFQWELLLSKYDMGAIPTSVDSVTFGDISRVKKRGIKHLIVVGMTDDSVPHISQSTGIFTDAERDELNSANLMLGQSAASRLFGDVKSVYDALTTPECTLTLCVPEKGTTGEAKTPSYIFETAARILGAVPAHPVCAEYKTAAIRPCTEFAVLYGDRDGTAAAVQELLKNEVSFRSLKETALEIAKVRKPRLSPEQARKLYGEKINMTASRVDKYNSCRFSYFLKYGLKAKPRTPAEFDASVIGTFLHYILENVTRDIEKMGGFQSVTDDSCAKLAGRYINEFIDTELNGMKDKTARFKYLFDVLTEDAVSVVLNMAEELRKSDFRPVDFELEFSRSGEMTPYEVRDSNSSMTVSGIVDRVDGWVHDGKLYVRVVDYKTGYKSFSLSDIWYGMGMQMLIYLFALEAMGEKRYGKQIVPAGVLYAPAREVLLAESRYITDEELEKKRLASLRRSGIIWNNDIVIEAMERGSKDYIPVKIAKDGSFTGESLVSTEQLGLLAGHIRKVILEISREILSGDISADPYFRSQIDNSCQYCDYYNVCNYDETRDGSPRRLTKLKTPEVWEKLRKESANE